MAVEKHVIALLENSSATLGTMAILFAIQGGKKALFMTMFSSFSNGATDCDDSANGIASACNSEDPEYCVDDCYDPANTDTCNIV